MSVYILEADFKGYKIAASTNNNKEKILYNNRCYLYPKIVKIFPFDKKYICDVSKALSENLPYFCLKNYIQAKRYILYPNTLELIKDVINVLVKYTCRKYRNKTEKIAKNKEMKDMLWLIRLPEKIFVDEKTSSNYYFDDEFKEIVTEPDEFEEIVTEPDEFEEIVTEPQDNFKLKRKNATASGRKRKKNVDREDEFEEIVTEPQDNFKLKRKNATASRHKRKKIVDREDEFEENSSDLFEDEIERYSSPKKKRIYVRLVDRWAQETTDPAERVAN